MLLKDDHQTETPEVVIPNGPSESVKEITWTQGSLTQFWEFLRELREVGAVGELGLSFHAAPRPSSTSTSNDILLLTTNNDQDQSASSSSHPARDSITNLAVPSMVRKPNSLWAVDHVKVHHDARYSKRVRNALCAWRYEYAVDPSEVERTTSEGGTGKRLAKIRVLNGARLVLLDERNRGIMTC